MKPGSEQVQELLVEARRKQILDAATRVFAEKGFHRATVKEIAHVAGIADGTVYTYFESKTAVLLGILNRLNETEQRQQQLLGSSQQDARTFFSSYLRERMSMLWSNAEVFRAVLPEILVNEELRGLYYNQVLAPTFKIAEDYFDARGKGGKTRAVQASLTVRAIAGTVFGLLVFQLLGDEEVEKRWKELPDVLTSLLFDGLPRKIVR